MMCFVLGKDQKRRDAGQAEGPILTMRQGSPQYVGGKGERRKIPQVRQGAVSTQKTLFLHKIGDRNTTTQSSWEQRAVEPGRERWGCCGVGNSRGEGILGCPGGCLCHGEVSRPAACC